MILTPLAWGLALWRWLYIWPHGPRVGYDLLFTWQAEKIFAAGGHPYSVSQFVYPPSLLLMFRPLAALSRHAAVVGGEAVTIVAAVAGVAMTAAALRLRWWGLTAAVSTLILSFTGAMLFELRLENLSVLEFLALAGFLLLALRNRWLAAAAVLGISMAVKPMLLPLLIVLLVARKWKALGLAVAIPAALNLIALAFVGNAGQALGKLPFLVDRTGHIVIFNSAWVGVARELGLPDAATILLRVFVAALAVIAAWLAWTRLTDDRLRLIHSTGMLLLGTFAAGTLSEYHFMLTLVPLAMSVVVAGSPIRFPTGWLGMAWTLDVFQFHVFGLGRDASESALRAIGMSVVLLTVTGVLLVRPLPAAQRVARTLRLPHLPAVTPS